MEHWWRGAVIYQIYPRSFCDSSGDGVGDLGGIIERLDYVADLGVDAIWVSPFFPSPMHDFGYDISDFCGVDPVFGSLADFDRLLAKAHGLGLKVIIDQVYSHSSVDHPWFQQSRSDRANDRADWYVWADARPDGSPPNNWQSIFSGPAWTWDAQRQQYYLHNFLPQQPDLNLANPRVQDAILDVARFWLDRGVDGFRLDATNFYMHDPALRDNPPRREPGSRPYEYQDHRYNRSQPENFAFIARLRRLLDSYPDTFSMAEIGDNDGIEEIISYADGPDRLHSAYSFVFLESPTLSAELIDRALEPWQDTAGGAWPSWAFSNHDAPRVVSRWGRDDDARFAKILNATLACLRGTILLYQGQELGLPQADVPYHKLADPEAIANWPNGLGRDGARTPMPWHADRPYAGFSDVEPWLPVDPRHLPLAVDVQQRCETSIVAFVRRFLTFRRGHTALLRGGLRFIAAPDPLVAFERHDGADRLLCAFNLGDRAVTWRPDDAGTWTALPDSGLGGACTADGIDLPPFDGIIARPAR